MSIFSCLDFVEDIPVIGDIDRALSSAIDDFGDWITGESSSSSSSTSYDDDDDEIVIRHHPRRRVIVIEEPDEIVIRQRSSTSDDDFDNLLENLRNL